ncbi:MAG: SLBB domain-containing protein [Gammaproteobacteria bacterium]
MVGQYYVEELINYLGIDESRIEKERVLLTRAEDLNQVVAYDQPIKMVSNQVVYIFNKSEFSIIGPAKLRGNLPLSKNIKLSEILENLEFDRDLYPFVGLVESFDPDTLSLESKLFNLNQTSTQNIEITNFSKVYFFDRSNFRNYSDLGISGNGTQLLNDYALRLNYRGNTINMPVYGNVELSTVLSFLGLDLSDVELGRATYVMPLKDRTVVKPYNEITLESSKFHSASLRFKNSELITVYINGEANYPGTLTLNKSTTFKDLYSIIGGLSDYAFQDGIILQRESVRQQQIAAVKKAQESLREYLAINQQLGQQTLNAESVEFLTQNINPDLLGRIGGDFSEDSKLIDTFLLEDGDTIFIPRKMNTVTIIGEVLSPNTIVYQKGKRLNKYINMAGGYKDFANKRNTYVIKANGVIEKKKWNLLFQTNSIGPGDVIVVPRDMTIRDNPLESIALITRPLYDLAFSAAALDSIKD